MHINDSKCALGSRRDRHENVGRGMIGITMFECIMADPRLDGVHLPGSCHNEGLYHLFSDVEHLCVSFQDPNAPTTSLRLCS